MSERSPLLEAREAWQRDSQQDAVEFEGSEAPLMLRRSNSIRGALASLNFGGYCDLDGSMIQHPRAIHLEMIMSEHGGSGGKLLESITAVAARYGLAIVGTPQPLKPKTWSHRQEFDFSPHRLVLWYAKHGFRIVQDGKNTRVVFVPTETALRTRFNLAL
jgi:hypothetical protein